MRDSPNWTPQHATLPRPALERLQVRKLRTDATWAQERVPYHIGA